MNTIKLKDSEQSLIIVTSVPQLILTVMIPITFMISTMMISVASRICHLESTVIVTRMSMICHSDNSDRYQNINDLPSDNNDHHQNIKDLPSDINNDCYHDINSLPINTLNLASTKLPPKTRKRGRPRGADLTVIGLPLTKTKHADKPVKFLTKSSKE